ncbi:peptidoglycan -binding protein [Rhodophyticola sp. SM2404]
MAFHRRTGNRFTAAIWPGFVDAITALLMVMIFLLTIFMVVQFVLSEEISTQDEELNLLNSQLNELADALGLEQGRADRLEARVATLGTSLEEANAEIEAQQSLIATLNAANAQQTAQIASFEEQVASLLAANSELTAELNTTIAERDATATELDATAAELAESLSQSEALNLALAQARSEIDAAAEAARLAAARREALEALVADLETQTEGQLSEIDRLQTALSEEEAARLVEAAAAEALRERLQNADAELTAMTLALEEQRREAEETLTMLAAASFSRDELAAQIAEMEDRQLTEAERQAALLAVANQQLAEVEAQSAEGQRRIAVLNEQIAALRSQLGALQALLDASEARDAEALVQIEALGSRLNAALAQVAAEQSARANLEAAEAARLALEAQDLERYRSEFFGRLRELLEGREGVRIEGDRFVFSSEVLFTSASAELLPEGRAQIANVAQLLLEVSDDIPEAIDWIIRVDGHTDNIPLFGADNGAGNWRLSQARALSVVLYMSEELGIPPFRLAATGFGEFRPIASNDSADGRAQNRRIELKLTER